MPSHDLRDNLVSGDGSGARYGYGLDNRLRSVTGTATLTLGDDPVGRLRDLGGSSGGSTLLYAGDQLAAEYARGAAAGATPLKRFVPGAGLDTPVATIDGASGARLFHHADERGSLAALSNEAGNAVETFA